MPWGCHFGALLIDYVMFLVNHQSEFSYKKNSANHPKYIKENILLEPKEKNPLMTSQDDVSFLNGSICLEPAKWTFFKPHIKSLLFSHTEFSAYNFKSKWASCPQFLICSNLKRFYKFLGNLWAPRYFPLKSHYNNHFKMVGKKENDGGQGAILWWSNGRRTWVQQCVTSGWPLWACGLI